MNVSFLMPSRTVVDPRVLQSALALTVESARHEIYLQPEVEYERLSVQNSRDSLAELFLASGNEWSFWMDADMIVPADAVDAMLRIANVDPLTGERFTDIGTPLRIVTGIYYGRGNLELCRRATKAIIPGNDEAADKMIDAASFRPILHVGAGQKWSDTEPFEVEAAGMGCMLVHRNVFQSKRPYFDYAGEDYGFCGAARKAGYKIFALPSVQCGHIGTPPVITAADYKGQKNHGR